MDWDERMQAILDQVERNWANSQRQVEAPMGEILRSLPLKLQLLAILLAQQWTESEILGRLSLTRKSYRCGRERLRKELQPFWGGS